MMSARAAGGRGGGAHGRAYRARFKPQLPRFFNHIDPGEVGVALIFEACLQASASPAFSVTIVTSNSSPTAAVYDSWRDCACASKTSTSPWEMSPFTMPRAANTASSLSPSPPHPRIPSPCSPRRRPSAAPPGPRHRSRRHPPARIPQSRIAPSHETCMMESETNQGVALL